MGQLPKMCSHPVETSPHPSMPTDQSHICCYQETPASPQYSSPLAPPLQGGPGSSPAGSYPPLLACLLALLPFRLGSPTLFLQLGCFPPAPWVNPFVVITNTADAGRYMHRKCRCTGAEVSTKPCDATFLSNPVTVRIASEISDL